MSYLQQFFNMLGIEQNEGFKLTGQPDDLLYRIKENLNIEFRNPANQWISSGISLSNIITGKYSDGRECKIIKIPKFTKALEETGYWIDTDTFDNNLVHIYECSKCHKTVADNYINLHKYCLHCGNIKNVKEKK